MKYIYKITKRCKTDTHINKIHVEEISETVLCKYATITFVDPKYGVTPFVSISGSNIESKMRKTLESFYVDEDLHLKVLKLFETSQIDNWQLAVAIIQESGRKIKEE